MTKSAGVAAAPTTAWRNRITGSGEEAPDQLLAYPSNWRLHPRNQQAALAGALDTVGWVQQVMVYRRTGFVVDGHAGGIGDQPERTERARPVRRPLSPEKEALVLATLDPIGVMAIPDQAKLAELLAEVTVDDEGARSALLASAAAKGREHPWCSQCGARDELMVDHIVPLSSGRTELRANLPVLCTTCHNGRLDGFGRRASRV